MTCPQCGTAGRVNEVRRRWRRPTFWCGRCGASTPTVVVADEPHTTEEDPLAGIMPAEMAAWVVRRHGGTPPARLDRAVVYQLYRAWDEAAGAGLPAFSAVVGALHAAAYDLDTAYPDAEPELRERAAHARTWLYRHARDRCWILATPTDPDDHRVERALAAIRADEDPGPDDARAAQLALFAVEGGPGLRKVRRMFTDDAVVAAMDEYLRKRDRPLRTEVLARFEEPW